MSDKREPFWGIVELFGHNQIAGIVTEDSIGGCSFIRVDMPPEDGRVGVTKWFGNGAIYAITPASESVVRAFIRRFKPSPVTVFMPEIRQLEHVGNDMMVDQGNFFSGHAEDSSDAD
jgi:hypothetical protein